MQVCRPSLQPLSAAAKSSTEGKERVHIQWWRRDNEQCYNTPVAITQAGLANALSAFPGLAPNELLVKPVFRVGRNPEVTSAQSSCNFLYL